MLDLSVDAAWAAGLLLAIIRIAAFVAASPLYARFVPMPGRVALALVLGFFFASPLERALDLGGLLQAAVVNAVAGVALGFLTGLIFHLFAVAGSLVDFTSGLSASAIIDPVTGSQSAVFSRIFHLTAVALFFAIGGDRLVISGLAASFAAVPVDGSVSLQAGLADAAVALVVQMVLAAVELAIPALAALFVAEVLLGIAARFAPQTNVFLLGLPAKVLGALLTVSLVLLLTPETFAGASRIMMETFSDVVGSLAG